MSERDHALVIGLTGGIASGKSAVSRRFEAFGISVYDADIAAREVIQPGSDGLAAVVMAFGNNALEASGQLDRPAMRQRVFTDPAARQTLESIIHPRVRQWLLDHALADRGLYCVLAIPLLVENIQHYRWIDRVLVVDVPESTQVSRLIARDGIDKALALRMLTQQATRAERLALADDVIENDGEEVALDEAVATLHRRYLKLAS